MKVKHRLLTLVLLAPLAFAACSGDPAARKQKFLESGNTYFDQGQYASAIIEYRNAVQIDATFGEARKRLGRAYEKTGDGAHALEEFVRAADLLPRDVEVQLTAGSYLLAVRKFQEAMGRADVALKVEPNNIPALLLRGNALAGLSSFDEALKAVEQAIQLDPTRGTTLTHLGFVELARGERAAAEDAFKKAVQLSPNSVEAFLALGNFYWAVGKAKETEAAFQGALRVQPENPTANRAMAALSIAIGRPQEAEQYLLKLAKAGTVRAEITLADYYVALGRSKDAIATLEKLRGKNGKSRAESMDVSQKLARAYAFGGEPLKARSLVDEVLKAEPKALDAQLLKGQLLLDDGHRDDALSEVRSAVSSNPESVEAQFALGRMYAVRGDNAAAETAFREVLRINPRASAAQVEIANLELASGRADLSVRTAEEAAKAQPRNYSARLALVRSLLATKDLARAEREIAALRTAFPNAAGVHTQAGMLALLKNDVPAARAAFERAQTLDTQSLDVLAGMIALDFKTNNPAAAKTRIEQRLKTDSSTPTLLLAARTYWTAQDAAATERLLRQAIDVDPTMLTAYDMLGRVYVSQGRLDQARKEFETLAAKQTRPVAALTMTGLILQAQGNIPQARKRYEEAIARDSRAVVASNNLAWILAEAGENLDTALQLAQSAVAGAPNSPELQDTLGWVYYKKKQPLLAIPVLQQAVDKSPSQASYHYHLGLAYLQAGENDKGRAALQRALDRGASGDDAADIRRLLAAPAASR